jgi:hypothetical protein
VEGHRVEGGSQGRAPADSANGEKGLQHDQCPLSGPQRFGMVMRCGSRARRRRRNHRNLPKGMTFPYSLAFPPPLIRTRRSHMAQDLLPLLPVTAIRSNRTEAITRAR